MSTHNIVVFASFDTQKFRDPESEYIKQDNNELPFLNVSPSTLVYTVSTTVPIDIETDKLSYSTTGITGLVNPLTSFAIPKVNFANQNIYFVTKVVSVSGSMRKRAPRLETAFNFLRTNNPEIEELIFLQNTEDDNIVVEADDLVLELYDQEGELVLPASVNFVSNFGELTGKDSDAGGFFKGYFNTSVTGENMRIKLVYDITGVGRLSGYSTPFDIFPSTGIFDIRKVNEDHNEEESLKKLTFQPALQFQPVLMEELLGQIVGNKDSLPETLGIKLYERIANFTKNIADPDVANLKSLNSLINEINITVDKYQQQFPPSLSRLLDIISVSLSKQLGGVNQFQGNFNDKGFTSKGTYGKNKGSKLDFKNTILNTGEQSRDILAYEKFSEKYTVINSNILSATNVPYVSANAYPLSGYNKSWGWGLVIPDNIVGIDIEKYYTFYNFDKTIEGSYQEKFIDFDNTNNTYLTSITSYNDYIKKWGIAEKVISHNLYTNLDLISG